MTGRNAVLCALGRNVLHQIQPFLERVSLARGTVLYEPTDVVTGGYFPVSGMVSLIAVTEGGDELQVAAVTSEGFVGLPVVLHEVASPHRVLVQVAGDAYRITTAALTTALEEQDAFRHMMLRYAHRHMMEVAHVAICRRSHSVLQRFCDLLLVTARCARSETIALTQESFAGMLGSPRSAVSRAATTLQDRDVIRLRHGRVHIVSRAGLARSACGCGLNGPTPMWHVDHRL